MLNLWDISTELQESLGPSRKASAPTTPSHLKPLTLSQEFAMIAGEPGVILESADLGSRNCVITASYGHKHVQIKIMFPLLYPHSAPPSFEFLSRTVPTKQKAWLMEALASTAQQCVEASKPCLKPCITALMQRLAQIVEEEVRVKNSIS